MIKYIDDSIVVANKPSGLNVIQDGFDCNKPYLKKILEIDLNKLYTVHRIDRGTSGLVIFARTKDAHRQLNFQFQERKVIKKYLLLVHGTPEWGALSISNKLKVDGDRQHRTVTDQKSGKNAVTDFICHSRHRSFSLIESRPKTGLTHQIRAHISVAGHPIIGDHLYRYRNLPKMNRKLQATEESLKRSTKWSGQLCLHATKISFVHPSSMQVLTFIESPPEYFGIFTKLI